MTTSFSSATRHEFRVSPEDAGRRLDVCIAARTPISRARVQALMAQGWVFADGVAVSVPSRKARPGTAVAVLEPPPTVIENAPQDIPLRILYEDPDLLAVDKPAGLVVHPAPGHADGTLVNALLHHCGDLPGIGGALRPGIVHRLDRETSGVMVVAKSAAALVGLAAQFQAGTVRKTYLALVHGVPHPAAGRVETLLGRCPRDRKRMAVVAVGGRRAVTAFRVVEAFPVADAALLEVRIETGRTHQIRVHARHLRHPVLGDPVYGALRRDRRLGVPSGHQYLHAQRLGLRHPVSGAELAFDAPMPADFAVLLERLRDM